jgi:hypothetical protein
MSAITLAIFGQVFEAGARTDVKSWTLLKHLLPPDQPLLFSKVTFSDGSMCSYAGGPGLKPIHHKPEFSVDMPLPAAMGALRGSPETLIDFLYLYFGARTDLVVPGPVGDGYGPFYDLFKSTPLPAQRLLQKSECASKLRKWRAEAKVCQEIINRVGNSASRSLLKELRVELHRTKKHVAQCDTYMQSFKKQFRRWFDKNKDRIAALLGPDVAFIEERAHIYIAVNGHVFTSGAETLLLAAQLVTQAPNIAEYNLVLLPDHMVDDKHCEIIVQGLRDRPHLNVFMPRLRHHKEKDFYDVIHFDSTSLQAGLLDQEKSQEALEW